MNHDNIILKYYLKYSKIFYFGLIIYQVINYNDIKNS